MDIISVQDSKPKEFYQCDIILLIISIIKNNIIKDNRRGKMADFKLFELKNGVRALEAQSVLLEKELQNLVENNMETFFEVKFIKSEYSITQGRIDSLGIDENNCPVIFEYKRGNNDNVINQGLFYLDWLMDHQADFQLLVMQELGEDVASTIDWSAPSVICIARDFNKYDLHAVNQMQRNIKLVTYHKYDDDLILFEYLNAPNIKESSISLNDGIIVNKANIQKTHVEKVETSNLKNHYEAICSYIETLGEDLSANQLKYYLAYKKVGNVFCIEIYKDTVIVRTKLDPDIIILEEGFTRDTRNIGHYGTGDLEITIKSSEDFEKAKPLLDQAYDEA